VAQARGRWRVLVNTVMNLRAAEQPSASQEGLCSMGGLVRVIQYYISVCGQHRRHPRPAGS
jgi:hypothetical protein